jgi:Bacterial TSP3 repeat
MSAAVVFTSVAAVFRARGERIDADVADAERERENYARPSLTSRLRTGVCFMSSFRRWCFALLLGAAVFSSCSCPVPQGEGDAGTGGNDSGIPGNGDGGPQQQPGPDAGPQPGPDGGPQNVLPDAGPTPWPPDPTTTRDSDCDGLSDAEEYANTYPGNKKTLATNADSDGDGISDGMELGRTSWVVGTTCTWFVGDANPATKTLPTEPDSDADGLPDGVEDANRNGRVDPGETDPSNADTDGDHLTDGTEDADRDGFVDFGESDPRKRDSDQDGISDGTEVTVLHTDPTKPDSDADGCLDSAEDANQNGLVDNGETDPRVKDCGPGNLKDTDGDGIPNAVEDRNFNGVVDAGETNAQSPDTDGDLISDGLEDKNKNGVVDAGETDPRRKDSDCDGLSDGVEDSNQDGLVGLGESDPTKFDTDGDGLTDGIESGITTISADPQCGMTPVDQDPTTRTDPTKLDSDGDGIADGAEDINQNGRVDGGELNPQNFSDGSGPAGKACGTNNLKPVFFGKEGTPDIQLGLPNSYSEIRTITVGGTSRGMMGYDPFNRVAFLAYRTTAPAGDVAGDELSIRGTLAGVGSITSPITQLFPTTWDGHPAMQAFYDQAGGVDVKTRANQLANTLIGPGAGVLLGSSDAFGPYKLQAQYVRRSPQNLIVLIAIAPAGSGATNMSIFTMADTAGGSALAQFADSNAVQCETFNAAPKKVDFLFVVDDSLSMADSQNALGAAATAMATALGASTLDFRIALVTSAYHLDGTNTSIFPRPGANAGVVRGWASGTTELSRFQRWLTKPQGACPVASFNDPSCCSVLPDGWVGICGSGAEGILGGARKATNDLTATTAQNPVRPDADLVVVLLGDADDLTTGYTTTSTVDANPSSPTYGSPLQPRESVQNFIDFFRATGTSSTTRNTLNKIIPVHGIVCPPGANCNNEWQETPVQRHGQVINATSGIRGDIGTTTSIQATMNAIVNNVIAASGYKMQKPPIGASVKVALDVVMDPSCNKDDLPRSRTNGFDFNGLTRTISFFGTCRPGASSQTAAVSYRYWVENVITPTPAPCSTDSTFYDPSDPDHCRGRLTCNTNTNLCECPPNCGATAPPGMVCNSNKLVCDFVCSADCGGACSGYQTCNQTSCSCQCSQSATCAPGFTFVNNGSQCGCFCDAAALNCGATYQADTNACACVCKPNCGGCRIDQLCNIATCTCEQGGVN